MPRIISEPGDPQSPMIAKESVKAFFTERARKIEELGPTRAVIYQDKDPSLAIARDAAEKKLVLPKLMLDGTQRILDIGCGTGRWATELIGRSAHYHGLDFSPELISYTRSAFPQSKSVRFSVASADSYSLSSLSESKPFDRILCSGVLIYLNDEEVVSALDCIGSVSAKSARVIFREPMGIDRRLTIVEHFSDEMAQNYNAIYRSQPEIMSMISAHLFTKGFRLLGSGDVYANHLNNRSDTIQRWVVLERP